MGEQREREGEQTYLPGVPPLCSRCIGGLNSCINICKGSVVYKNGTIGIDWLFILSMLMGRPLLDGFTGGPSMCRLLGRDGWSGFLFPTGFRMGHSHSGASVMADSWLCVRISWGKLLPISDVMNMVDSDNMEAALVGCLCC